MFAAVITTMALAFAPTPSNSTGTMQVDFCSFHHGAANNCAAQTYRGNELAVHLAPSMAVTVPHMACDFPRVNGRQGRWADHHTLIVWRRLRVVFDGITFGNAGHQNVSVYAYCTPQ